MCRLHVTAGRGVTQWSESWGTKAFINDGIMGGLGLATFVHRSSKFVLHLLVVS